jgi:hypothetical protein
MRRAFHFFGRFSGWGKVLAMETIENWSLKIGHLSSKQNRQKDRA